MTKTKTKTAKKPTASRTSTKYAVRWIEKDFQQTYASGMTRALALTVRSGVVKGMTKAQAARVKVVPV